jgi:acetyl/propionyl-CoA carboxylase alpha subunit
VGFLINVLEHPAFRAGRLHTGFVDEHLDALLAAPQPSEAVRAVAAFARSTAAAVSTAYSTTRADNDPWSRLEGWGR